VNDFGQRRPIFSAPSRGPATRNPLLQSSEAFNELKFRLHQRLIEELDPTKPQTGTYSGIAGGADIQDCAVQESMGGVYDRTQEHLGTTDSMIIVARRVLINAAKALRDHGTIPPGVENPSLYRLRSGGALLPKGVNGLEVLRPVHFFETDSIEVAALTVQT